jgi:8-oxo-dGTP pyrophosphatase MutT (NUDIX family)
MAIVKDIFAPLPHPDDPAAIYLRVLCLVFHGERVLLIFQPEASGAGWWNFPGGRVERGEDPLDTAQRELFEETGLRADLEFRGVATAIIRSTGEHWSMFLFAARVDRADIVPSSEGPLRWAAPAEIGALPVFPDAPYLLKHLKDPSGGVVLAKFTYAERDPGSLEVASIRISVYGRR